MAPANDKHRHLDELIARRITESAQPLPSDELSASRIVTALARKPLPRQRRARFGWSWPNILLDFDFAPAWPRVAALACAAALGCAIGFFGLDARVGEGLAVASTPAVDGDLSTVSEPEPITGVRP
jgi:hypothetical protein